MDLSIIIPVYNESKKVRRDIGSAAAFLQEAGLSGEIIVVDDGSSDTTAELAEGIPVPAGIGKTVLRQEGNRGKGHAVRTGVLASQGEYVLFADSGCCISYRQALIGLNLLHADVCDIAHGSRKLPASRILRPASLGRRLLSRLFRVFVLVFMDVPDHLTDTQCGFKLYKGEVARDLYKDCRSDGFAFDVETILLAIHKHYRIREFPVEWESDPDTRVIPVRMSRRVLYDFILIRKHLRSPGHKGSP